MPIPVRAEHSSKGLNQEVTPFLWVDPPQTKHQTLVLQCRINPEKFSPVFLCVSGRRGCTIIDYNLVTLMRPEDTVGQKPLLLRGE